MDLALAKPAQKCLVLLAEHGGRRTLAQLANRDPLVPTADNVGRMDCGVARLAQKGLVLVAKHVGQRAADYAETH